MDLLKEALKDEIVKKFSSSLTEEEKDMNANLLYQQAKYNKLCLACQGKKECLSDVLNMQSYLDKTESVVNRVYYPCSYKQVLTEDGLDVMFFPDNEENAEVFISEKRNKIFQSIQNYKASDGTKGIYLYGPFGCGKTYLLLNLAKYLARKGKKIVFAYYPELVRKAKSSIMDNSIDKMITKLKTTDVLMLDDIGGEMNSSFIRDEFLGPILQYRMSASLPTFMTSNYDIKMLQEHLSITREETNLMKASRLIERILYMMEIVELKDENYRR